MVEDYWSTIDQGFSGKIKGMIDGSMVKTKDKKIIIKIIIKLYLK